jgi:hydroxypyruvate reductase
MALAAAVELEGAAGITFAALGTDGVDGTTNACGAIVTGATAAQARSHGYDPATTLHARRAHELLGTLDCLVRTGPTGTNVNELYLALVQPVR